MATKMLMVRWESNVCKQQTRRNKINYDLDINDLNPQIKFILSSIKCAGKCDLVPGLLLPKYILQNY
jgi:hypothetical protein